MAASPIAVFKSLASLGLVFQIFSALLSGALVDKFGRRLTLFIADLVTWSVPCLIWAVAQDMRFFIAAAVLNGLYRVSHTAWTCLMVEDAEERHGGEDPDDGEGDPDVEVAGLLTTINSDAERVAMHAVRRRLLLAQAAALATLDEMEADDYRVLQHRVALSPLRKLWLAWTTAIRESRRRRRHRRRQAKQAGDHS